MPYYRGGEGVTYDFGLKDLASSRWDAAKTSAEEGMTGGLMGILSRSQEDYQARTGMPMPMGGSAEESLALASQYQSMQDRGLLPKPNVINKQTADERVKQAGVSLQIPTNGISEDYLNVLIRRKLDQNASDSILSRAPSGFTTGTVNVLAGIAGSLVDPTNIAAAFIPVVGEARYAAMLEKAGGVIGRTAVRAGVGAAEGAVGQAMLEPFVAMDKISNQQDYGFGTALTDIAMGAGMGSVAHVGFHAIGRAFGEVRDRWVKPDETNTAAHMADRISPDINEAAVKAVIAADANGKAINVDSILRLDPRAETPNAEATATAKVTEETPKVQTPGGEAKIAATEAQAATTLEGNQVNANTTIQGDIGAVKESVTQAAKHESDRVADFKSANEADAKLPEAKKAGELEQIKTDTEELMAQVRDLEKAQGVENAEVKAAVEYEQKAQTYAAAVKAAAICGVKA